MLTSVIEEPRRASSGSIEGIGGEVRSEARSWYLRYPETMQSVAGDLRRESMQRLTLLTAEERMALALRLGDEDVALYCAVHGTSPQDARVILTRARAVGRLRSGANQR